MPNPDFTTFPRGRAASPARAAVASQRWLLMVVGELMMHTGPFHEAAELAERSWIAACGTDGDEGALVWLRGENGSWSLLHQEDDGGLMPTQIKVRAHGAGERPAPAVTPAVEPAPAAAVPIGERRRRLEADAEDARKAYQRAHAHFNSLCDELAALRREERGA
jgi:hypothetical protein